MVWSNDWRDTTPERCCGQRGGTFGWDLQRGSALLQRSLKADALHQMIDLADAIAIVILQGSWLFACDQRRPQLSDLQSSFGIAGRQRCLIQLAKGGRHVSR